MTRNNILIFVMVLELVILLVLNLCLGEVNLTPLEILNVQEFSIHYDIIFNIRFPRVVSALCAGILLSLCGQMMQTYFQNYLAGPYVLGISSGSALGIATWVMGGAIWPLLSSQVYGEFLFSVIGAVVVSIVLLSIAKRFPDKVMILIGGLLFSHLCSGLISILMSISSKESLQEYTLWSLGSFNKIDFNQSLIFLLISFILVVFSSFLLRGMNLLTMGESYALSVGLDIKKFRLAIISFIAVSVAMVTLCCGPITFVGLIVPNFSRLIFKSSRQGLLFVSNLFIGANLCLTIGLIPIFFPDLLLPTNSLLSIIGTPFVFFLLLIQQKKRINP